VLRPECACRRRYHCRILPHSTWHLSSYVCSNLLCCHTPTSVVIHTLTSVVIRASTSVVIYTLAFAKTAS
jgi:hypothetical protein